MENANVTIKPMQKHINNGQIKTLEFINNDSAYEYFHAWCIEHNYEVSSLYQRIAGGIGHDYEITLNLK